MVNRTERNGAVEIDKLNGADLAAIIKHAPEIHSSQKNRTKENIVSDDLIGTLANAPENRRAQQVTEWERMRRLCLSRAA